ncbi:MAG: polysaccharide biosynthesis tyrosine autokinase, partial [Actinomycetota bacterium]|nr:polysaccharide biosynthesis tyrosine autokinase [Actinomycetota bacterium]
MSPAEEAEVDVLRYLRGLWRRKLLIALIVLLVVNLTLVLSLRQDPVYEGEARVLLSPQMFGDRTGLQLDAALAVQTEIQILESEPIRALVVDQLGPVGKVSAERVGQTLLISVKARAGGPRRAADITNAYARAYIAFRGGLAGGTGANGAEVPQGDASGSSATGQVVSPAGVPGSPVQPKPVRNTILAGIMGMLAAVGLASLLEALDDSVKTRADLRKVTELPVLGVIPDAPSWENGSASPGDVPPAAAEAFRSLRTSVQLLGVDRPVRTLQITSPGTGDGKTTVVANLAVVLARMGQRVAIIDADLRRPRLHDVFGLANAVGVTSVLSGERALQDAFQRVPLDGSLVLLASGPPPPNPSELLASKKMAQLVHALGERVDVIVVDSPPVLAVTDAIVLTTWSEAVVLVCAAGRT